MSGDVAHTIAGGAVCAVVSVAYHAGRALERRWHDREHRRLHR